MVGGPIWLRRIAGNMGESLANTVRIWEGRRLQVFSHPPRIAVFSSGAEGHYEIYAQLVYTTIAYPILGVELVSSVTKIPSVPTERQPRKIRLKDA